MLPTTGVVGFPPRGFRPTTRHLVGGLHANRGPMVRRLSLLQHGAVSRLAHAALILGEPRARHPESEQGVSHPPWGGQHQMYPASMGRFGTSLLSAVGAATVDGSRVRGRITAARANGPVWTERTTMPHALTGVERTDSKPPAGQSAVVRGESDALPPTAEAVGFRATQL